MDCDGGVEMRQRPMTRQDLNRTEVVHLAAMPGRRLWMTVNPSTGTINFVASVDGERYGPTLSLEAAVNFYNREVGNG